MQPGPQDRQFSGKRSSPVALGDTALRLKTLTRFDLQMRSRIEVGVQTPKADSRESSVSLAHPVAPSAKDKALRKLRLSGVNEQPGL